MLKKSRELKELEEKRKAEDDSIKFETISPGDATNYPKKYDTVGIHYKAYLEDGTCIDNSYNRGQPIYFILGSGTVIKGWERVLLSGVVSKGQKIKIVIPPELAYQQKGYPPVIPPDATITYEMELMIFSSIH